MTLDSETDHEDYFVSWARASASKIFGAVEDQNMFVSISGKNDGVNFLNQLFQLFVIGNARTKDVAEGLEVPVSFIIARMINKPVNPIGLHLFAS